MDADGNILTNEEGIYLRQIVDHGKGWGKERFIVSGPGHVMSEHATFAEAKAAAVASLTESQLASGS